MLHKSRSGTRVLKFYAVHEFKSKMKVPEPEIWLEVEEVAERIRDAIGEELTGDKNFVRMQYASSFSETTGFERPQTCTFWSSIKALFRPHNTGTMHMTRRTGEREVRRLLKRGTA